MQNAINFTLIQELRMLGFHRFQFNGHFFARCHVGTEINVSKRTRANFTPQAVLSTDSELHFTVLWDLRQAENVKLRLGTTKGPCCSGWPHKTMIEWWVAVASPVGDLGHSDLFVNEDGIKRRAGFNNDPASSHIWECKPTVLYYPECKGYRNETTPYYCRFILIHRVYLAVVVVLERKQSSVRKARHPAATNAPTDSLQLAWTQWLVVLASLQVPEYCYWSTWCRRISPTG